MRIVPGFLIRRVAGENLAIPSGESAHRLSGLLALNDSGTFLFNLLQTERSPEELVAAMMDEYDVDPAVAQADVAEFLEILRQNGLLEEAAPV